MRSAEADIVLSMSNIIERYDSYTGGHARRTSEVSRILANEIRKASFLAVDEEFCQEISCAALLHDLGKMEIDSALLLKPGKLSAEEFEKVKRHPGYSAQLIEQIMPRSHDDHFLKVAINMARYHHEKMDGSGYPEGLIGEQIPLEARIMAIADVYDALVSKRPYKEAASFKDAFMIIEEGMGSQFDSGLNRYFLSGLDEIEQYYRTVKSA